MFGRDVIEHEHPGKTAGIGFRKQPCKSLDERGAVLIVDEAVAPLDSPDADVLKTAEMSSLAERGMGRL